MSLILDALNKSDQERSGEQDVPGLQANHGVAATGSSMDWKKLSWPVLTAVFAVIAVMLWMRGDATDTPATEIIAQAPAGQVQHTKPAQQLVMAQTAVLEGGSKTRPTIPQKDEASRAVDTKTVMKTPSAVESEVVARIPGPVDADVASLYAQTQTASLPAQAESAIEPQVETRPNPGSRAAGETKPDSSPKPALDVDLLAQVAQSELANMPQPDEPVVEHAVPLISDLSQAVKDEIPSVFFTVHLWSTIPHEREVVLNGEPRHEGDTIKPGLKLLEILEDSIVMDYRGTEFRLRSLNSWVNL